MKKTLQAVLVLSALGVTALFAAEPEFSADMTMRAGGQTIPGKAYYSKMKMRYEMPEGVSIVRLDQQASYVLLPAQKMYMKQVLDKDAAARIGAVTQGETERVSLGKETVNGRDTQKYRVRYSGKDGDMSVYQWLDKEEFPVKVEAVDGTWSVEYAHLVSGPQPDSLFEVPADYKTLQIPSLPANIQTLLGGAGGVSGGETGAGDAAQAMEGLSQSDIQDLLTQAKAAAVSGKTDEQNQ